jgi:hypothetical protein
MEGRSEQVWPEELERERLTVRPGHQAPPGLGAPGPGGTHYVHTTGLIEDGTCPFHKFCIRTDLEVWRPRWVTSAAINVSSN